MKAKSSCKLISPIGHVYGNKIASRKQVGFTREVFPHFLQLMYRMFGQLKITSHQTVYPEDETLAETSVLTIEKVMDDIPVFLKNVSEIY
jgi:hypothetical protein